jgi:immune inhibitor A
VDLVVFIQPTLDGACGGASNNHLWSHRFVLYTPYSTHSSAPLGGFEKVRDYILQSGVGGATACDGTQIMPIGTVAHETGHGFGLPDLYDTGIFTSSEGIGEWGLMGEGNYSSALSPSRMEAWSLNELGWVTLAPLTTAGTYSFGAAPVSDTAFYIRVPGSNPRGEYFLLENRQASQSDSAMIRIHCANSSAPPTCGGGMLIWHVDSLQVLSGLSGNTVNTGAIHGLALVQADARGDLDAGRNRGDAGDLYPGVTSTTAFSLSAPPLPVTNLDGSFAGFTITAIQQVVPGGAMSFGLQFGAPALSLQAVIAQLLAGSGLTAAERNYLDVSGNHNSQFDLGDFLAWVQAMGAGAP